MSWDFPEYPPNWNELKKSILKRDKYRCSRCGANNLKLHVHHIRSLSRGGSNHPSNLTTLCEYCHGQIHPHLRTSGQKPAHIKHQAYFYCPRCKTEHSIKQSERFCPTCGTFLLRESREIHIPVQMPKQGCFIATAAYGSPFTEELDYFRAFRDTFLNQNMYGRMFVKTYYQYGPFFSKIIEKSERKRYVVRMILDKLLPFVKRGQAPLR